MDAATRDKLIIFDTTLRDGEQAPGCSMNLDEKLKVAHALEELGVDVIEAGFPAASPGDFESVREVAAMVENATVCGLARCTESDIERAGRAVEAAKRGRVHVFVATSAIHREHKLKMAKAEILRSAVEGIRMARSFCDDVEFSPEDASRTELDFLAEVVTAAIEAGATTINVPDTVGYTVPEEFAKLFRHLREHVPNIDAATLSVHCHNDLGMAVANSLAAVSAGVRQVECTINGIGERAGNCSLEEVVMAVRTRAESFGVYTDVRSEKLYPTSRLVSTITGMPVPRNKAVVGENAFAHEAGIHQHGVLKHRETYEIMRPEDVGFHTNNLVLGKHSGRHAFRDRIVQLGYEVDEPALNRAFADFKKLADRKKEIFDSDLEALILHRDDVNQGPWRLEHFHIETHSDRESTARVILRHDNGNAVAETSHGSGPIEAAFHAIENVCGVDPVLTDFDIRNVSMGEDAQGEVVLTVEHEGASYRASAIDTDIVAAAARAFLDVVNRMIRRAADRPDTEIVEKALA